MSRSLTGTVLGGRYRLEERLGAGGMGAVYRAQDLAAGRSVAVKILLDLLEGEEHRHRFRREFRILTRLSHPCIVVVYDHGQWDGTPYFVMELLAGADLAAYRLSRGGRLPEEEILSLAVPLCQGLSYIHAQGLIDRDLKPGNVMLAAAQGRVPATLAEGGWALKLMDFGLARRHDVSAPLTSSGALLGTVNYMAPEQAQGQPLDARADLYALGVILYELAAGRLPFTGDSPVAVLLRHIQTAPIPLNALQADLSPAFVDLVMRLLAKPPAGRPATADDVLEAVQQIGEPPDKGGPDLPGKGGRDLPDKGGPDLVARPAVAALHRADVVLRAHLVGREAELARLLALLDRAWQRQGALVVVEGEAGVGKTRLVRELNDQVRRQGGKVLTGSCYEGERLPYGPFVEAFRTLVDDRDDDDPLFSGLEAELQPLLPGLESNAELPALEPNQARLRLFDATSRLLARLSNRQPLLLVLDDLHWIDDASLELLGYLVRNSQGHPILICGTIRQEERDEQHPLTRLIWALSRQHLVERIELAPLPPQATADLLAALLGLSKPPEALAGPIFQYAEGNPFFVEELVRMLAEEGRLQRQDGRWQLMGDVTAVSLEALSPPSTISDLIERRLSAVPAGEREVLERAAVLGREFTFDALLALDARASAAGTGGHSEEALLDAITDLLRTRLIEEVRDPRQDRYRFSHGMMQEVIYAGLPGRRRRLLHHAAGKALEQLFAGQLDLVAGQLAHHFVEGGDPAQAVTYGRQAGDQARRVYANQEAIHAYRLALKALESLPDAERAAFRAEELALNEGLGDVCLVIGEYEPAAVCFRNRLALLQAGAPDPEAVATTWQRLSACHKYRGQYGEAILSLEWGLGALEPAAAFPRARAALLLELGWIAVHQGRPLEAIDHSRQALQLAEATGDDEVRAGACDCLGTVHRYQGNYTAAVEDFQRSLALKEAAGDKGGIARTLNYLGIMHQEQDDFPAAQAVYLRALGLCEETGHRLGQALLYNNLGVVLVKQHEYQAALANYEKTLAVCKQIGHLSGIVMAHNNLGEVYHAMGAFQQALEHMREAESLAADLGERERLLHTYDVLAAVYVSLQNLPAASDCAHRALDLAQAMGIRLAEEEARERLARVLLLQGQTQAAREQLHTALELSQAAGHRDLTERLKEMLLTLE